MAGFPIGYLMADQPSHGREDGQKELFHSGLSLPLEVLQLYLYWEYFSMDHTMEWGQAKVAPTIKHFCLI